MRNVAGFGKIPITVYMAEAARRKDEGEVKVTGRFERRDDSWRASVPDLSIILTMLFFFFFIFFFYKSKNYMHLQDSNLYEAWHYKRLQDETQPKNMKGVEARHYKDNKIDNVTR